MIYLQEVTKTAQNSRSGKDSHSHQSRLASDPAT